LVRPPRARAFNSSRPGGRGRPGFPATPDLDLWDGVRRTPSIGEACRAGSPLVVARRPRVPGVHGRPAAIHAGPSAREKLSKLAAKPAGSFHGPKILR